MTDRKLLKFYFQSFLLGVPVSHCHDLSLEHYLKVLKEIRVGFRTPSGRLTETQTFKTVEIPRLIRGKPNAWDPNLCLEWGNRFLSIVKSSITGFHSSMSDSVERNVWRASFLPGRGVELALLNDAAQEEVRNGEDRIGFLPRSFWDSFVTTPGASTLSHKGHEQGL